MPTPASKTLVVEVGEATFLEWLGPLVVFGDNCADNGRCVEPENFRIETVLSRSKHSEWCEPKTQNGKNSC